MLSGIAGGLLCLYAGVAYNELRSCSSIAYMYLCGAYPLAQVFSVLAIIAVVQTLIAFKTINLIKWNRRIHKYSRGKAENRKIIVLKTK